MQRNGISGRGNNMNEKIGCFNGNNERCFLFRPQEVSIHTNSRGKVRMRVGKVDWNQGIEVLV